MTPFTLQPVWRVMLRDLGLREADVLRRAGLPTGLLARPSPKLPAEAFFRLWDALLTESGDPLLPLHIGQALTTDGFDPPLFAALASPDLATALGRLARFKQLIGPMRLDVVDTPTSLRSAVECSAGPMPGAFGLFELVFQVRLARLATRHEVIPLEVTTSAELADPAAYRAFFGVRVSGGAAHSLTFSAVDARRPFLTLNPQMWRFFEPELARQLSELDASATARQRVRSALLELLPSGRGTVEEVAGALGITARTLQRRLRTEGTRFTDVLGETRERLALHYLERSSMSAAEISFLLGYEDPNSFFRAFSSWTGQTPERVRARLQGDA